MDGTHGLMLQELQRFYAALDELERRNGPARCLMDYTRADFGSARGVYFFFQDGEDRSGSGQGRRVVRVGTHGLRAISKSTLWSRLSQHRGSPNGGGNQGGSVFRRHVGHALMEAGSIDTVPGWGSGSSASAVQLLKERSAEAEVSKVIRHMNLLWLRIDGMSGSYSLRGYVKRNAIALLTSPAARTLDPPSHAWLGWHAPSPKIRMSGLWNINHVDDVADTGFVEEFEAMVQEAS